MTLPVAGYDYEGDAIADGVVAYYPMFDKYTTSVIADLIGGRDLSVINDPDDTTRELGSLGYQRNMTANGQDLLHAMLFREATVDDLESYDDWTVAIWFNPTSLTTGNTPHILDLTANTGFKAFFSYPASVDTFNVTFTQAATNITSTVMPTLGNDHLLIVTHDSATTTIEVFLDNVSLGTDSSAASNPLAPWLSNMYFGDSSNLASSTTYLDGKEDEIIIYNRAMDATDRTNLWNLGAGIDLIQYANQDRAIVFDILGLTGTAAFNFEAIATDILGCGDAVIGALTQFAQALDSLAVGEVILWHARANPTATDDLAVTDAVALNVRAGATTEDTISFIGGMTVDGEIYVGVVMNTENKAITEYMNFNFNSMARAGVDRYLAAKADGIYKLGGDTDDTAEISAHITTKMFDFGADTFKRMDRAYLGVRNDGELVLKVVTRNTDGEKHENWYELEETSPTLRTQRVKIGKGLKSHFWQFTLINKQGSDFELDSIEFKPIILSRRI